MSKIKTDSKSKKSVVARNKRARFDYHIEWTVEAGIVLHGTEVKSLRSHHCNLEPAYARIENEEAWLIDFDISEFANSPHFNHTRRRKRKLLLHRREIAKLEDALDSGARTLVPLEVYFNEDGRAKVELAVGTGKKAFDKRQAMAERDARREIARVVRRG